MPILYILKSLFCLPLISSLAHINIKAIRQRQKAISSLDKPCDISTLENTPIKELHIAANRAKNIPCILSYLYI